MDEGQRHRAIAQQLRTPEGTVGRWLSEARQALRKLLTPGETPREGRGES